MARTVRSFSVPTVKPKPEGESPDNVAVGMPSFNGNSPAAPNESLLKPPNTLVDIRNDSTGDFTIETYKPAGKASGQSEVVNSPAQQPIVCSMSHFRLMQEHEDQVRLFEQRKLEEQEASKKSGKLDPIEELTQSSYREAISNGPPGPPGPNKRAAMNQQEFDELFGLLAPQNPKGMSQVKRQVHKCCEPCMSCRGILNTIYGFIPMLSWIQTYNWKQDIVSDIIGGLSVGVLHVPQGMAYGTLAGLDPVYGLYTSFFPSLFYMFFGTSRHCSLGVFAAVSLMVGRVRYRILPEDVWQAQLAAQANGTFNYTALNGEDPYTPITVVTSITLAVGIVMIIMGILRLDFITAYLSDQLVSGFTTGAACHVFVAQWNKVLGVGLPRYSGLFNLYYKIRDLAYQLPDANICTVIISVCTMVFLLFGKEIINPRVQKAIHVPIPFELVVVVIGTIVSYFMNFQTAYHVHVIENIPVGLPPPRLPRLELLPQVFGDAIGIAIVIFVVTVSMGKLFAKKHDYKVDARQELYALGFMEVLCSFFSVYPASTALARSLVYEGAGTKTQFATVFSALLLLIVLYLVGPLLYDLPMCVLGSLVMVALKGMFMQLGQLKTLWPVSKIDFLVWLVSFVVTVVYDVSEGLFLSVVFALLTVIFRLQWARSQGLGWMEATTHYREESRYNRVRGMPGMRIIRFNAPLLFTNVERFKRVVHRSAEQTDFDAATDDEEQTKSAANGSARDVEKKALGRQTRIKHMIIDCAGLSYTDSMGAAAMKEVFLEMDKVGIRVYFAMANAQVQDLFRASGFLAAVPKTNFYPSVEDAVACIGNQNQENKVNEVKARLRTLSISE